MYRLWNRSLPEHYFERGRKRRVKAPVRSTLVFGGGSCTSQQERESQAATHAEGGESESSLSFVHLVEERGRDAHAGAADRMAQRDRAAANVQLIGVEMKLDRKSTRPELQSHSFI